MNERLTVPMQQSFSMRENIVLPGDTNSHDTLFGGLLMKHIDETAAISARRHCRAPVVTASNDGVHFHRPIRNDDIVCLHSYVASVGRSSMEIFIKITTENTVDGSRQLAAISFLTFVALDADGKPTEVPLVKPESEEEKILFGGQQTRREARLKKREETDLLIKSLSQQN